VHFTCWLQFLWSASPEFLLCNCGLIANALKTEGKKFKNLYVFVRLFKNWKLFKVPRVIVFGFVENPEFPSEIGVYVFWFFYRTDKMKRKNLNGLVGCLQIENRTEFPFSAHLL